VNFYVLGIFILEGGGGLDRATNKFCCFIILFDV